MRSRKYLIFPDSADFSVSITVLFVIFLKLALTGEFLQTLFVVAEAQTERALLCDRGLCGRRDRRRRRFSRFAISAERAGVSRRQRPVQVSLFYYLHILLLVVQC